MNFKILATTLAFSLSMGLAQAAPQQISVPYKPSGIVLGLLDTADVWAEVYPVAPANLETALGRAMLGESPTDQVSAVVIESTLHFALGKSNEQLPEQASNMERDGKSLKYDEQCGVFPKKGDRLFVTYGRSGNGLSAELDVRVVKYLPFSEASDDPLDMSNPEECAKETHSRMFLSGTIRFKRDGKVFQTMPVLMQSIVEPRT